MNDEVRAQNQQSMEKMQWMLRGRGFPQLRHELTMDMIREGRFVTVSEDTVHHPSCQAVEYGPRMCNCTGLNQR